jgi:hypothetical protein
MRRDRNLDEVGQDGDPLCLSSDKRVPPSTCQLSVSLDDISRMISVESVIWPLQTTRLPQRSIVVGKRREGAHPKNDNKRTSKVHMTYT